MSVLKRICMLLGLSLAAGLAASCSGEGHQPECPDVPSSEEAEAIGTYRFGDRTYDIMSGSYVEDDYQYIFSFSPLETGLPRTTYFIFGIKKYFCGKEVSVGRMYHNEDYIFIYEDPVWFYSQYRKLQEGTVTVRDNGDGGFTVKGDFLLNDGRPFSIDFEGSLPYAETGG